MSTMDRATTYAVDGPEFYQSFDTVDGAISVARDKCKETGNSYYVRTLDRFLASVRMDCLGRIWIDVLEMEGALL